LLRVHLFPESVIKKGGGNRPLETLATLCNTKKVLHSILLGADNPLIIPYSIFGNPFQFV